MLTRVITIVVTALCVHTGLLAQEAGKTDSPKDPVDVIPIPVIFSSPETGFAFGAAVLFINHPLSTVRGEAGPNVLRTILFYTVNDQILGAAQWERFLAGSRNRLVVEGALRKFPDKFYGIGPDTRDENEEDFTPQEFAIAVTFQWRLAPHLYLGPSYIFSRNTLFDVEEGGILDTAGVTGVEGVTSSGLGFRLNYDNRDNGFYPLRGRFFELEGAYFPIAIGSTEEYSFLGFDYREYIPLFTRSVLALQYYTVATGGAVPFQYMPKIGNMGILRGYRDGRFRDEVSMVLQGEYRFPVVWRFGATLFGGVGQVGPSLGELSLTDLKAAGGFGIRFRLSQRNRVNLRMDFAFSDEYFMYFNFSEAF